MTSNNLFKINIIIKVKKEVLEQIRKDKLDLVLWADEWKLVRELGKGVQWQTQVERRWLAGLLGDEKQ